MQTVVIFGAQGKFGSKLYKKLIGTLSPEEFQILGTVDKSHNRELAEIADVIVISVQPVKVRDLLQEIAPYLKETAKVVSCAAQIPLKDIQEITQRKVSRFMADPWWNASAILLQENAPKWLSGVSASEPIIVDNDNGIDEFTVYLSYLFVVLLLEEINSESNYRKHLEYLLAYFNVTSEKAHSYISKEYEPQILLQNITTSGGISESIYNKLINNIDIEPQELVNQVVKEKFFQYRENQELRIR